MIVSNKVPFCKQDFKYFIGFKDPKQIKNLCICRPEISIYRRDINKTKGLYSLIKKKSF